MKKLPQVLLLAVSLVMTGHAVLTPMLMVTGDFLSIGRLLPGTGHPALSNREQTPLGVEAMMGHDCFLGAKSPSK